MIATLTNAGKKNKATGYAYWLNLYLTPGGKKLETRLVKDKRSARKLCDSIRAIPWNF